MIFETYYTLNDPKWRLPEMIKYRHAAEKRLAAYYRKHRNLWDAIDNKHRRDISLPILKRHASEGMLFENMTLGNWLKHIERT